MPRKEASDKDLESAIKTLMSQKKVTNLDTLREVLKEKNLSINESRFYKHLYQQHLYDWKEKANPDALETEREAEQRIDDLEKTLSQVKATLESTADGILMISREGKLVNWNQKFMEMFRIPASVLAEHDEQKGLQYFLDQVEDPQELFNLITRCYDDPNIKGDMGDMHFKDGRIFERYSQPHLAGEQIIGRVWSFRDVTERRKKDQELHLRERAIEASTHGVVIIGNMPDYNILYVNPAFLKITHQTIENSIGQNCFFWLNASDQQAAVEKIRLTLREQREDKIIISNHNDYNKQYWIEINIAPVRNEQEEVTHFVWIVNDITQQKIMEEKLAHQATHDSLTELPNRSLLQDRLQQTLFNAKRKNQLVAICFLDLDRFKLVNDGLGHALGDDLLKIVAENLSSCMREIDTVARLGGDEFVLICLLENQFEIIPLLRRVLEQIAHPIQIKKRTINITASIGVSFYPDNGTDIETLTKNADIAMYRAKELGRDNFQFYTAEMNTEISRRLELENDLHIALAKDQFELYYQPIVNLDSGQIIGVEVLLRWKHPLKGMISPTDFIPIAEDSGLIIPIGEWVLETACIKHKILQSDFPHPLTIALNISSQQLKRNNFIEIINNILEKSQIPPELLELELTESILIEDSSKILATLNQLKSKNIKLVIDDFGTGYSNLGYLKQFPLDKLKIDKSFIDGVIDNPNDAAIAQTIIAMAHILGLTVVAEGVETLEQMEFLKKYHCDEMQGYYFCHPLDEKHLIALLKENPNLSTRLQI